MVPPSRLCAVFLVCLAITGVPNAHAGSNPDDIPLEIKRALLTGQTSTALSWLREAAAQGNANAAFTLAGLYRLGEGVERDPEAAARYLSEAAAAGHPRARELLDAPDTPPTLASPTTAFSLVDTTLPPAAPGITVNWQQANDAGETPLVHAARTHKWQWVVYLAETLSPAQLSHQDNLGNAALHYAAAADAREAVSALLSAGAAPDTGNQRGSTPLHLAVTNAAVRAAKLLIAAHADPTLADHNGWSATMLAERSSRGDLQFLVPSATAPATRQSTQQKNTALLRAVKNGETEAVRTLLSAGADASTETGDGTSALLLAIQQGDVGIVNMLLDDPAVRTTTIQQTAPLITAVTHGRNEVIKQLLAVGADADATDAQGRGSLHHAASAGCESCTKLLLNAGADVNRPDNKGDTPLILAAKASHASICALLLENSDTEIDAVDARKRTALWWAVSAQNMSITRQLLSRGAALLADNSQRTPVHLAVEQGDVALLQLVLQATDLQQLQAMSINGNTLLHVAARHDNAPAVSALLDKGMGVDQSNLVGDTPLIVAARQGSLKAATVLIHAGAAVKRRNHQLVSADALMAQQDDPDWQQLREQAPSTLESLWARVSGR